MKRQLQIRNGVTNEWQGNTEAMPVPPMPFDYDEVRRRWVSKDGTTVFVDVTNRPDARLGDRYDLDTDTFTPPPPPPDYGATVGPRDFLLLFTPAERKAIRAMAKVDEDVADVMALAETPQPIRLKHPTTIASLDLLVTKGLLTAVRAAAIQNSNAL